MYLLEMRAGEGPPSVDVRGPFDTDAERLAEARAVLPGADLFRLHAVRPFTVEPISRHEIEADR